MTIAELLVQTEARIYAAYVPYVLPLTGRRDAFVAAYESAANEALRIVAAVYGEPCQFPSYNPLCEVSGDYATAKPSPGDPCMECRWPRSSHGAKS